MSDSRPEHEGQFLKIVPFYKSLIISTLLLSGFILCYLVLDITLPPGRPDEAFEDLLHSGRQDHDIFAIRADWPKFNF